MKPNLAELVIQAFGGLTKTSRALNGVPITTVYGWKQSGQIPDWRRDAIIEAAEREKVLLPDDFMAGAA